MKITDLKLRLIEQPITSGFRPNWGRGINMRTLPVTLVEISTDEGVKGYSGGPTTGEELLAGVKAFVKPSLIGADPFNVEYISDVLSNSATYGMALVCEAAVWDIVERKPINPCINC